MDDRQAIIVSGSTIDRAAAERIEHLVAHPIGTPYRA
jgi:hypothetical protein